LHSLRVKDYQGSQSLMMSKKSLVFILIFVLLVLPINFVSSLKNSSGILPKIATGIMVVPGTNLEKLYLSAQSDTWIDGDARRSNGFVQYEFSLLEGLPVIIELDSAGPYIIDVSMGGGEFESIYSSGQTDGALSGRMKRQIRVDIEPADPMRIRLKRRESASAPFTFWRLSVLRVHDIFPGSEIEKKLLVDEGKSTLSDNGGRIIPENSSISFSLTHAQNIPITVILESDNNLNVDVDGFLSELIVNERKRWTIFELSDTSALLKLTATSETKLTRLSIFYGFAPIDTKSEVGKMLVAGERGERGIKLSDVPVSITIPPNRKYFWCVSTDPEKISIYGFPHTTYSGVTLVEINSSQTTLNITGVGDLLCFAFDRDEDEDGLPSFLELTLGTDPFLLRTDNDDLNDGIDKAPLDTDNDGLNDNVESFLMISVKYPDTDNDGSPDGLGLAGHKTAEFCARVSDKPWIGAKFQDTTNHSIIPSCRRFGTTSMVIPFNEILTQRKPDEIMLSAFESAGDCDGFLLDMCALSEADFNNFPSLKDEYQLWAKRLWTDIQTDDSLAFTLHNFVSDRVERLLKTAREYTNQYNQQLAVSIPSPSEFESWIVPYNGFKNIDRIIVIPPNFAGDGQMYSAGVFDALFIGKPFYVEIMDEKKARAYISGVRDTGLYLGSSVNNQRPLVLSGSNKTINTNFVQIVNESTVWSKKLDFANVHQNWQTSFATKEYLIVPSRVDTLGNASVAILDIGTTFISHEELPIIEDWIRNGGNLLVYENANRFDELMWWGTMTTFGELIAKNLEIFKIEMDKSMNVGDGHLYITKTDPMFSVDIFKSATGFEITPFPSSYSQITEVSLEANSPKMILRHPGEYPRSEYPIQIKPDMDKSPYVIASTCAVPWVEKRFDNVRVLAQAPRGMCSVFAVVIPGKPLSVTSNTSISWSYKNGILFVSFVASGGGDGFVISMTEGLDLSAINLTISPTKPEEQTIATVMATIYNSSKVPSGEYSVTFHWDELSREKQFKRSIQPSISALGYEYISFPAPVYLEPGKHKLYMMIHTDDEINITNNEKMIEFEVLPSPKYKTIVMQIDNTIAFVDADTITLDSPPVIRNGRTMVPFRFLAESLGAEVGWNAYERRVSFTKGDIIMYLWIGKKSAIVNSEMIELDSEPIIINGRTMVPLRVISENLGASVSWDGATRSVTVTMQIIDG